MRNKVCIGVDISKTKFDAHSQTPIDRRRSGVFQNQEEGFELFLRWLKKAEGSLHVCMESTGIYSQALARFLYARGIEVSVINPARSKHYARALGLRSKTDAVDAAMLARFAEERAPRPWSPPPAEIGALQESIRRIDQLKADLKRERNRAENLPLGMVDSLRRHESFLVDEIARLEQEQAQLLRKCPTLQKDMQLLCSIPGIAEQTALRLLVLFRAHSFQSARQAAAFIGVTPRHVESGSSLHPRSRISKAGDAELRRALFMPARSAKIYNPLLKPWAEQLNQRGLAAKAVTAACMRKLIHIAFGVLKHQQPFNENWAFTH